MLEGSLETFKSEILSPAGIRLPLLTAMTVGISEK